MRQGKHQAIGGTMYIEIVQNRLGCLSILWAPGVDTLQTIDSLDNGASGVGPREGLAGGRTKGPKDRAFAAPAIIDLLAGTFRWYRRFGGSGGVYQLLIRGTLGRFRPHVIPANHDTLFTGCVESASMCPFFW